MLYLLKVYALVAVTAFGLSGLVILALLAIYEIRALAAARYRVQAGPSGLMLRLNSSRLTSRFREAFRDLTAVRRWLRTDFNELPIGSAVAEHPVNLKEV